MPARKMRFFHHEQLLFWLIFLSFIFAQTHAFAIKSKKKNEHSITGMASPHELIIKFENTPDFDSETTFEIVSATIPDLDSLGKKYRFTRMEPFFLSQQNPYWPYQPTQKRQIPQNICFRFIFADTLRFDKILPDLKKIPQIKYAEPNYAYLLESGPITPLACWQEFEKLTLDRISRDIDARPDIRIGIIDAFPILTTVSPTSKENPESLPDLAEMNASTISIDLEKVPILIEQLRKNSNNSTSEILSDYPVISVMECLYEIAHATATVLPAVFESRLIFPVDDSLAGHPSDYWTAQQCTRAITDIVDAGVQILVLNCHGEGNSDLLREAIDYATARGTLIIAGAGNNNSEFPHFPAAFEPVLAVAATNHQYQKTENSNFGIWIDVSAPTGSIDAESGSVPGSALSAIKVTGLAALLLAQNGALSPDSLKKKIIYSCVPIDSTNEDYQGLLGAGQVDFIQALQGIHQPNIVLRNIHLSVQSPNTDFCLSHGDTTALTITVENIAADVQNVTFQLLPEKAEQWQFISPTPWRIADFPYRFQTANVLTPFQIALQSNMPVGANVVLMLSIFIDNKPYKIIPLTFRVVPRPPQRIQITDVHDGQKCIVTWTPAAASENCQFYIYRRNDLQVGFKRLNSQPVAETWFIDQQCEPEISCQYAVTAVSVNRIESTFCSGGTLTIFPFKKTEFIPCQARPFKGSELDFITRTKRIGETHAGSGSIIDIDQNGFPDSVFNKEQLIVSLNNGGNSFLKRIIHSECWTDNICAIDLNQDLMLDIVGILEEKHQLEILINSGENSFAPLKTIETRTNVQNFLCSDVDENGTPDLILIYADDAEKGFFEIWLNQGDSQFEVKSKTAIPAPCELLSGDIDNDGDADFLVIPSSETSQSGVIFFRNDGALNFNLQTGLIDSLFIPGGTLSDVDADGDLDFIVGSDSTDLYPVYLNNSSAKGANTAPTSPENFSTQADSAGIRLIWDPGRDEASHPAALTYHLKMWTD
ncbi:VCBS repeat-containing protein, partial [candidate division KSB1 bacterium]|nr:VCBS repeat-containing protein [candidate division KSB1 bacterium]